MSAINSLIRRVWRILGSYVIVRRPKARLSAGSLAPLFLVLPFIIYAWVIQDVVVTRTERHEHQTRLKDLDALEFRLNELRRWTLKTCRDYAHWDDIYAQTFAPDRGWIDVNLENGLGNSFGFDLAVLQKNTGEVIWQKNLNASGAADISRYGILRRCEAGDETAGVMLIDGRGHICAAVPVLKTDRTGRPRGMLFVALRMDEKTLARLEAGSGRALALAHLNGRVTGFQKLGAASVIPEQVDSVLAGSRVPDEATVAVSRDRMTSYGLLPLRDVNGRPFGSMIEVASREALMANIASIKRMSFLLMLLCAAVGAAGTGYARTRALAKRATRDYLTGLFNHGYLQEHLKNELQRAARYDHPLSVAMLDVDHFKVVNDTHGHAVGDFVLQRLAELLLSTVRETDLVARYGGEELMIVMPETGIDEAINVAERVRSAVQACPFVYTGSGRSREPLQLSITVSIGVATYPGDGSEPANLSAAADVALAAAKATRNAVVACRDVTEQMSADQGPSKVLQGFLRDCRLSAVRPLVAAINHRIPGSEAHSERVAAHAVQIGIELGWSTQDLSMACRAALLSDVGKIGVPERILTSKEALTDAEMALIRQHPRIGAEIISRSPQLAPVSEYVLHHHERFDGQGYPDGLAGEDIPLISRVLAVADAIVAMTSERTYRKAMSIEQVIAELKAQAGKQFDPQIVEVAVRILESPGQTKEARKQAA